MSLSAGVWRTVFGYRRMFRWPRSFWWRCEHAVWPGSGIVQLVRVAPVGIGQGVSTRFPCAPSRSGSRMRTGQSRGSAHVRIGVGYAADLPVAAWIISIGVACGLIPDARVRAAAVLVLGPRKIRAISRDARSGPALLAKDRRAPGSPQGSRQGVLFTRKFSMILGARRWPISSVFLCSGYRVIFQEARGSIWAWSPS